ncbi:MAG: DUF819 domain-containing protein [Flavobacteriales bacterium]
MQKIVLSILFSVATLCSYATSVRLANESDYQNKEILQLDIAQGKHSIYLDKHDSFILDWANGSVSTSDSVFVKYNSESAAFQSNSALVFSDFKSGEMSVDISTSNAEGRNVLDKSIGLKVFKKTPLFKHEAITFGLLMLMLALVFFTNGLKSWSKFYRYVPALLLCYFLPAILNSLNIINGQDSELYYVASRFLLPASLVLLCLSIDLKGILNLGPKALIMFFAATAGVVIGGPLALWIVGSFMPDALGGDAADALWRGLSTVAGSWIGGGANQTALKEIAECPESLFSKMILVDVALANVWMAFLLFGAGMDKKINKFLKADNTAVEALKEKVENYQNSISRVASLKDYMVIIGIAFVAVGFAHWASNGISPAVKSGIASMKENGSGVAEYIGSFASGFFWLIVISTAIGVTLSFTKARTYEGAGASKIGSLFIYILVATIGMKINISDFAESSQIVSMLMIGAIWMLVHITILLLVAKLIKAPFFFVAVGSQANIGGAASAPVVASAFSPALAPVGVLLAVLGYAVGTVAAVICMLLMQGVS